MDVRQLHSLAKDVVDSRLNYLTLLGSILSDEIITKTVIDRASLLIEQGGLVTKTRIDRAPLFLEQDVLQGGVG